MTRKTSLYVKDVTTAFGVRVGLKFFGEKRQMAVKRSEESLVKFIPAKKEYHRTLSFCTFCRSSCSRILFDCAPFFPIALGEEGEISTITSKKANTEFSF